MHALCVKACASERGQANKCFAALHKILHSLCLKKPQKLADTASCENPYSSNSKLTTLHMLASGDKLLGDTKGFCVL